MSSLKPFVLNLDDLNFIFDQVDFRPLFDFDGNAIILWDGTGAIYDRSRNLIWNGETGALSNVPGITTAADALAMFGQSYLSTTSFEGLRDVSGLNNNLLLVHADWGASDQTFPRIVPANFLDYVKPETAGSSAAYFGNSSFNDLVVDNIHQPVLTSGGDYQFVTLPMSVAPGYLTTVDATADDGNAATQDIALESGLFAHQADVVDYTPRMISRLITTAEVTPLTDGDGHILNWDPARYAVDGIYQGIVDASGVNTATLVEGAAIIADYGLLATLGHQDWQKTPGSDGSDEFFIGAENPGVAPTNGWFALFGQFFDHGLDFVAKPGGGQTIKIALATDDPLYGLIGPDGLPTTSITISRAAIAGRDANGDPSYVNHTAPLIDQSQTYGSDDQMTLLLREWESTDGDVTFHAGMRMFDGQQLDRAWDRVRPDGTVDQDIKDTLPTLNELRAHLVATDRDDLSWEDVTDLRIRNAQGDVATGPDAGTSGQALLLDMNPRFDFGRLNPNDGDINSTWDSDVTSSVNTAVALLGTTGLAASLAALAPFNAGRAPATPDTFGFAIDGKLTLHLGADLDRRPRPRHDGRGRRLYRRKCTDAVGELLRLQHRSDAHRPRWHPAARRGGRDPARLRWRSLHRRRRPRERELRSHRDPPRLPRGAQLPDPQSDQSDRNRGCPPDRSGIGRRRCDFARPAASLADQLQPRRQQHGRARQLPDHRRIDLVGSGQDVQRRQADRRDGVPARRRRPVRAHDHAPHPGIRRLFERRRSERDARVRAGCLPFRPLDHPRDHRRH